MSTAFAEIEAFFSEGSPLESALDGFAPRPEQRQMAGRVAAAMAAHRHLAIEAGAGTGKTLAYLVPALLSGQRVIVATGTRTLQDQLYHRDLPVLGRALGRPVRVAQLKGRANYLCQYRLAQQVAQPDALGRDGRRELALIQEWGQRTDVGDIGEVGAVGEDSTLWPLVTSTADNCLGRACPNVEQCHVVAARRRAVDCDLAIVNHHLLLADMTLKDDGFGRLLPGAEVVIVDEAHRFPETAQSIFDVTLHTRQIDDLLRDAQSEALQTGALSVALQRSVAAIAEAIDEATRLVPLQGDPLPLAKMPVAFGSALAQITVTLESLTGELVGLRELSAGLGRCAERVQVLAATAARVADWEAMSDLSWVQRTRSGFSVHVTPLDSSEQLRALLDAQECSWIFTSATLALGDDFSHFSRRIGISNLETARIDSPFDFARSARLYLPAGLPQPASPDYTDRMIDAVLPLLRASQGRAFLLFTSRRALQRAAELLAEGDHGHSLLVQGTAPRSRLLDRFIREDSAVLLGTATFWEGVDIRGPALVVVAIDKLPFASPGDPLMQARLELVRRNGGDPFRDYQLPQAVLALRQGAGRLIRGTGDYGVVMICDPRLTGRGYGRAFIASLPPMPIVRSADEACAFLASHQQIA